MNSIKGGNRLQLLPNKIKQKIPTLGATDGQGKNAVVWVKFFTPRPLSKALKELGRHK